LIGVYQFKVLYRDIEISSLNSFAVVTETTYVELSNTLLLAMPFNLYEEDQNPTFGMSAHLMPIITEQWLTYKVVLRDRFGNALFRSYKYVNTIRPFSAFLTNQ
jgi:hypothetical protein